MIFTPNKKRLRSFTTPPKTADLTIYELLNHIGWAMSQTLLLQSSHILYNEVLVELMDRMSVTFRIDDEEQQLFSTILETLASRGGEPDVDTATLLKRWARLPYFRANSYSGAIGEIYNQQTKRARAGRILLEPWFRFLTAGAGRPEAMICGEHSGYLTFQENPMLRLELYLIDNQVRKNCLKVTLLRRDTEDHSQRYKQSGWDMIRLANDIEGLTARLLIDPQRCQTVPLGRILTMTPGSPSWLTLEPAAGFTFSYRF